ncbi:MAG TPA: hypothetical protein VIU46_03845 [Gallionellaceae bacterium]
MRVKSHWYRAGRDKSPQELAGAAAFNIWRIGQNALKNMRSAGFEIAVGAQYFAFLSEFLIFLVQLADRIAYRHLDEEGRAAFTTELANRVGDNLAENQAELMGGELREHKAAFIAQLNLRGDEYAQYDYQKGAENFSFVRSLGLFMQDVVDETDRQWVTDQIMAAEAPEAIATLEKAMSGFLELEPRRPSRSANSGCE